MSGDAALAYLLGGEAAIIVCALALPLLVKPTRGLLAACTLIVAASCAKAVLLVVYVANAPSR